MSRKLSNDQVVEIRSRYARGGVRQIDLAREFGIARENVRRLIRGESYQDVGGRRSRPGREHGRKLTFDQVSEIRDQVAKNRKTLFELSAEFEMSTSTLSNIVRWKTYRKK
tara:strand:- start:1017 stop:1349 length:333 start_codon:yes stop_codon:yes gene_type:complete